MKKSAAHASGGHPQPEITGRYSRSIGRLRSRPGMRAGPSDPLANNPFWTLPEMMRNWDVANLSESDEQKLGAHSMT